MGALRDKPTIRAARAAEGELLSGLAMRAKAHWGYPEDFLRACRAELTYDHDYIAARDVFVIESDRRVVGFCSLERIDEESIELGGLFVEPGYIGKGLGRALMRKAMETAREAGARRLVIHGDPNARPFYEAAGAVQVGRVQSGSIPGRSLPLFEIDLGEGR